jgi:hypothetical protein
MLSSLKIRQLAPVLVVLVASLAIFVAPASAAPTILKHTPKYPAAGERVTVTAKGFKKYAKYKVIVNDKTYKRSYRVSKHGKLKFSFRMPSIQAGSAIFIAAKFGKKFYVDEVFISDKAPVGGPNTKDCESSPYPPEPDGTCPDWSFENGIEIDEDDLSEY